MTPGFYENLAVRLKPVRVFLLGLAVAAAIAGALPLSRDLLGGAAMLLWGLALAAFWFHPHGGIGPRSTRRRRQTRSALLAWSWPAAVFLDLWLAVGTLWTVRGIWGLT